MPTVITDNRRHEAPGNPELHIKSKGPDMNIAGALSIACECLAIRRAQWAGVAVPDHCMDGDPSDLIQELYEADPDEAAAMVKLLDDAAATLHDELEKYAPGGEL